MPYEKYHGCLLNPNATEILGSEYRYGGGASDRGSKGKKYLVKYARPPGRKTGSVERSYLYKTDEWTAAEARAHCRDHGGSFEAATPKTQQFETDYTNPDDNPFIPKVKNDK